jgi:hypothetical protein
MSVYCHKCGDDISADLTHTHTATTNLRMAARRAVDRDPDQTMLVALLPGFSNVRATQEQVIAVEQAIEQRITRDPPGSWVAIGRLRSELKRWAIRDFNARLRSPAPAIPPDPPKPSTHTTRKVPPCAP